MSSLSTVTRGYPLGDSKLICFFDISRVRPCGMLKTFQRHAIHLRIVLFCRSILKRVLFYEGGILFQTQVYHNRSIWVWKTRCSDVLESLIIKFILLLLSMVKIVPVLPNKFDRTLLQYNELLYKKSIDIMISRNHLLVRLLESVRIVVHRYTKVSGTTSLIKVEV